METETTLLYAAFILYTVVVFFAMGIIVYEIKKYK